VLWLLAGEGALVTLLGAFIGSMLAVLLIVAAGPWIQARFGIALKLSAPTAAQWWVLASVVAAGLLASLVPGWRAYRLSLADGLSPRT
jgi:putative ABC transport system permease protein